MSVEQTNENVETTEAAAETEQPSSEPISYMDLQEFIDKGFLQEANRQFFHPLGLALEIQVDEDGKYSLGGVWDYRSDPEGMAFAAEPDPVKAANVEEERKRHVEARIKELGWEIQPVAKAAEDSGKEA